MKHLKNIATLFEKGLADNILIDTFDSGKIKITSGKLIACDPLITNDKEAFTAVFPTGEFPVLIHKEKESNCIAYVEIIFSDESVNTWELALCIDQKLEDLKGEEIFGYPGQSGMGTLMDLDTQKKLNDLEHLLFERKGDDFMGIYEEFFRPYFFDFDGASNQFASLKPDDFSDLNLIAFETGYGEGFYASYIAFDRFKKPVKIISEFIEMA